MQVDVAASSAAEAVIGQLREVLTAAAAGAGVADGLPAKLHATVFLPLVSSEAQASPSSASHATSSSLTNAVLVAQL